MNNYTYGFDIGIASIGWSVVDIENNKLVDSGVRLFDQSVEASERRIKRSQRRTIRRRRWRMNQVPKAFNEFEILSYDTTNLKGYKTYTATHKIGRNSFESTLHEELEDISKYKSIFHLRQKALNEKVSDRELFIAIYSLAKTRGHFLLEHIDFEKSFSSEDLIGFIRQQYIDIFDSIDKENLEEYIIKGYLLNTNAKLGETSWHKNYEYINDETANKQVIEFTKFIKGASASLSIFGEKYNDKSKIKDIIKKGEFLEIHDIAVTIYNSIETKKIMSTHDYLCQKQVELVENYLEINHLSETDKKTNEAYKELKTINKNEKSPSAVRNMGNNYPNGLYVKEAKAILKKQMELGNTNITTNFINVISEIMSARIPYYIGPLDRTGNSPISWVTFVDNKMDYSYNYNIKSVDEAKSVEDWMKNMISRCSYFPQEYALPKSSFLIELFSILNELNNIQTSRDTISHITRAEKIKIINEVYLKQNQVRYPDIAECIGVENLKSKSNTYGNKLVNKYFTIYHEITKIIPKLIISNIENEILNLSSKEENSKINVLEYIIDKLNVFEDEKIKYREFSKTYSEEVARKLSKLNTKDYASISRKLICEETMNQDGETLIEILLNENLEQMGIIYNAKDIKGKRKNLSSSKYDGLIKPGTKLGIDLLVDKESKKPFIPISRTVVRSLNQSLTIYNTLIEEYGVPKKVVIETARDLKDFDPSKKKETVRHYDDSKKNYENLVLQLKEKTKKPNFKFEDIEKILLTNKTKMELYIQQNGVCLISGEKIDINHIEMYQVDHILPKGFGDNSKKNLMLIKSEINNKKSNRLPLIYIRENTPELESEFIKRVNAMRSMNLITADKHDRLLLDNEVELSKFIAQNLVDTRYTIKEFGAILEAHAKVNENDTKFAYIQGTFNSMYRNAFGLYKSRDISNFHHAEDAIIATIIDNILDTLYPGYQSGVSFSVSRYNNHLEKVRNSSNTNRNEWLRNMYASTFNNDINDKNSLITQLRNRTHKLSYKVNKKGTGQLFDQTIYSPRSKKYTFNIDKPGVLQILGVNNNMRGFSSVEVIGMDFYRISKKDKKGNWTNKFVGIHIPKAIIKIVNNKCVIDEKMYITLIKEHYKEKDLLNNDGTLNTNLFRFRAFKNDIIYETTSNQPLLYTGGSIGKKLLEVKKINSYSRINIDYKLEKLYKIFDLKKDENEKYIGYYQPAELKSLIESEFQDNMIETMYKSCSKIILASYETKKLEIDKPLSLIEVRVVIELLFNLLDKVKGDYKNTVDGTQITPSIWNNIIKQGENPVYRKLIYSHLGIELHQKDYWNLTKKDSFEIKGKYKEVNVEKFSFDLNNLV